MIGGVAYISVTILYIIICNHVIYHLQALIFLFRSCKILCLSLTFIF